MEESADAPVETVDVEPLFEDETPLSEAELAGESLAAEVSMEEAPADILPNPATKVVVKGKDGREPVMMLGDTAAAVVHLIDKFHKTAKRSLTKGWTRTTTHDSETAEYTEEEWSKLPEDKRWALLGG
jgi:hypothetical protein